jgi:SAM-dependent methyltransferase
VQEWIEALAARHLTELRPSELTRALRALSGAYVQRRGEALTRSLDSAGKRAAFAMYYAPLHFLTVERIVSALGLHRSPPGTLLDVGCGTGAAGAAWALAGGRTTRVTGLDRHPWAVSEAQWTYRQLGVHGRARVGDLRRLPPLAPGTAIIAAYVLNELPGDVRERLETVLLESVTADMQLLVVEPIARRVTPWWERTAARFTAVGARTDEWRFEVELPRRLAQLDEATGLRHEVLTARSLYWAPAIGPRRPLVRED